MTSPVELEDLVREIKRIYTHINTNARHLTKIEDMAKGLKAQIEALLPEEVSEKTPVFDTSNLRSPGDDQDPEQEPEEETVDVDTDDELPREVM